MAQEAIQQATTLDDLGFKPVIRWNRSKNICGWLLAHEHAEDPDAQIIFIDHNGKIQFGLIEKERLDFNQKAWEVARDYFTTDHSSQGYYADESYDPDDSLQIAHAAPTSADSIMEIRTKAEFREHLSEPKFQGLRADLQTLLDSQNILDANAAELSELVRLSSAKAAQVTHSRVKRVRSDLTSAETNGKRLTITDSYEKRQSPPPAPSRPGHHQMRPSLRISDHMVQRAIISRGRDEPDRRA